LVSFGLVQNLEISDFATANYKKSQHRSYLQQRVSIKGPFSKGQENEENINSLKGIYGKLGVYALKLLSLALTLCTSKLERLYVTKTF
jgi:hypothetical protein